MVAMGDAPDEGATLALGDVLLPAKAIAMQNLPLAESGPMAGNLGELGSGGEVVLLEVVDNLSDWAAFLGEGSLPGV